MKSNKLLHEDKRGLSDGVAIASERCQKLPRRHAKELCGRRPEVAGHCLRRIELMDVFEQPEPGAGVGRDVDDPDLLASGETLAAPVLGYLICQRNLSARQKQRSEAGGSTRGAIFSAALLAGIVTKHVGSFTRLFGRHLREFV